MRVTINHDTCTACAVCSYECSDVFEESDNGLAQITEAYRVDGDPTVGEVPDDLLECVQAAVDGCPEGCIEIQM